MLQILLHRCHPPPGRRLPAPNPQVAHPGGEAGHLSTDKRCTQGVPVLAKHLAHLVVGDGPVGILGKEQHPGLVIALIVLSRSQ